MLSKNPMQSSRGGVLYTGEIPTARTRAKEECDRMRNERRHTRLQGGEREMVWGDLREEIICPIPSPKARQVSMALILKYSGHSAGKWHDVILYTVIQSTVDNMNSRL